jgi:hypothetical protein
MWTPRVIDLEDDISSVSSKAVIVKGIYVNTVMSAHPCLIKNGTETLLIIPATSAAGTVIDFAGEKGVLFDTNLIVDPDDSATGNITIFYIDRT